MDGRSAIGEIPEDRWTKARYFHPAEGQAGKTYSFSAGVLPEIFAFDAGFFGISAREALSIDPQQRLMLELAHEAMEDSGQTAAHLAGSNVGVFVGASSWDFAAVSFADAAALDTYGMQGAALSSVANRVSYVYGLRGPSLTIDTACSSSLVALHLACEALRRGEIGQAIVGGVNLLLAPQSFVGFARASMLSRIGRCHSFDARADGYVRGEGGGAVIVKTLDQALADGDTIRAVIRGTGVNSDGRTNGFSVPNGTAQAELIRAVCERIEISADEFGYFEAHGTGTPVGDPIEANAIGTALARRRELPLPIGSVKSNVGHLEPASGMAGLMKLLVTLETGRIPPSLNFETPNPNIPFDELNLEVVTETKLLDTADCNASLLGINSFGFGGTNAHAVLAPPPSREPVSAPADGSMPLLLSARSAASLRALAAEWAARLPNLAPGRLPALLRGAARARDQHAYRLVVTGAGDAAALATGLGDWLAERPATGVAAGQITGSPLAFVFAGNGSQWAGMGLDALRSNAAFRAALAEVEEYLSPELGWSVIDRLTSDDLAEALTHTAVAQPLFFSVQVGIVAALRAMSITPVAHAGHSAGEVAAAWASGALSLRQACHVIVQRSLLQGLTHDKGGMAALGIGETAARTLIAEVDPALAVAAVNGASSVTIAGPVDAITKLQAAAGSLRAYCTRLDLAYAFHSPVMDPIRLPLLDALDGLESAKPATVMISTVTGEAVGAGDLDAEYWWRNVRMPVRFHDAVQGLLRQGVRNFLEIGPQPVLKHYLREALRADGQPGRVMVSLTKTPHPSDPFPAIAAECHVAGADLSAAPCFDGMPDVRGLPLYPWQRQSFTTGRTVEAVEVVAPINDHPLLGFRDPHSRGEWLAHLSTASEPWLADHVIDGSVLLPAAAMIEMAFAAARVRHPEAATLEIQDLEITRALVLEPKAVRDCRISVQPDGHLSLASRPRLSQEVPQLHATCRIIPGLGSLPTLQAAENGDGETIEAAAVYARARGLRLQYGPAFRTVERVQRLSPVLGVAELRALDAARPRSGYLLDPAMVDGSLQALLALVADDPRVAALGSVVPWRFGRIRLLCLDVAQPTRAVLHLRHIGPRSICADIALSDAGGNPVVEMLDCWFVAVPSAGAATFDRTFWTAYVPSEQQPATVAPDTAATLLQAAGGVAELPSSMLLADAYAAAAGYDALAARYPARHVPALADDLPVLGWLAEEGLASPTADGWQLAPSSDLPATDIWRSLFFGSGESAAECAMLAVLGQAVAGDASVLGLSGVLREQALFASPTGIGAMTALTNALTAFTAKWPVGRCLRVAVAGAPHAPLLRRLADVLDVCGSPVRLAALANDSDSLAALQGVLAQIPGASAMLWSALPKAAESGFDIAIDLYGLSLPGAARLSPDQLLSLLAPGGTLLAAEPVPNRPAALLFGPALEPGAAAVLEQPDAWCHAMCDAGFTTARHTLLDGRIWPAALLVATAPGAPPETAPLAVEHDQTGLIVFAAPNDPLATALAARQNILHLLPIEAMREVLTAPFAALQQHVVLLAADVTEEDGGPEALGELLADISAILQGMAEPQTSRLWLVSAGSPAASLASAALTGLRRVAANELPALECRAICLDAALPAGEAAERLLQELAAPDLETEVLWRAGGRLVPRLRAGLPSAPRVDGPRRLEAMRPGLIGSLAWLPASPQHPEPGTVTIEVYATALNFRDVMWAQGLLPDEALMAGFSGASLGLECAGVVTAVGAGVTDLAPGDRVAAVAPAALATHVTTRRNGVIRVPEGMDFASAATIPVAFMTAVYALGHLARLAPGESVLIHGGAGGVGLAAIQYALHRGAVVYATAGSEIRRQMLRMMGVAAAYDSRSTGFVDEILSATNGRGVDVVLNSLSHEMMKQSLRLLRPFGRFLEIGKRDLYEDTAVGLRPLRHNVSYHAIDVDELVAQRPDIGAQVLEEIVGLLESGELQPLPYRAFGFDDVVSAFRLLQASGHIGKIVLLPEPTRQHASPATLTVRADGVHIVTGGLSGFGLETARWLVRHGARRLALLSRSGMATPGADAAMAAFEEAGVHARAFACDVAEAAQLQATLSEIRSGMGPIRGVLHAAMVLDDAFLQDLNAARFATVIRPKLAGALALDRLTRHDPLDLFVLFSSVTTVIGTPGQASYVAANRALEALAERRHAEGRPALAVQWGPIGDAGYLVRETRVSEMLSSMLGASPLRADEALDALPGLLALGRPVVGLADVAWGALRTKLTGLAGPFWSEMPASDSTGGSTHRLDLSALPPAEAAAAAQSVLVEEIARILQQAPSTIDIDRPIQDFGVDSLMAVELRTALEARLGMPIPVMALAGAGTLRVIANRLIESTDEARSPATEAAAIAAAILRHEGEMADPAAGEAS